MSYEFRRRQRKKEHRAKKEYFSITEVSNILMLHDWECVFELDAPQKIVERLNIRSKGEWMNDYIEEFRSCFIKSEIYCPHEGIDRTKELNVNLNLS